MLEGLYSAAAGMGAQQRRMDALANDMANVNTAGYKHVRVAFRDLAYSPDGNGGTTGAGAAASTAGRGFAAGALRNTGRTLDLAIAGEGFFAVRRADGTRALTRDGSLQVDAHGHLTTSSGALLDPPLTVPEGVSPEAIAIAPDGTVTAAGKTLGKLAIVSVRAPEGLASAGDTMFTVTRASGPARAAAGARVTQGTLESSNVDMADVMVDLMDAQSAFGLASKAVQVQDQMMEIANGVKR